VRVELVDRIGLGVVIPEVLRAVDVETEAGDAT